MSEKYRLICYNAEHFRVPLEDAIGEELAKKYDLSKSLTNFAKTQDLREEIEEHFPTDSGYYLMTALEDNVTPIEYKRLDREMQPGIESMERMLFGDKGAGLSKALGITPSKAAKHMAELDWDERRRKLLKNQDRVFDWLKNRDSDKEISEEEFIASIEKLVNQEEN